MTRNARLAVALGVFVAWIAISSFSGALFGDREQASLDQLLSRQVAPQLVVACIFLLLAAPLFPRRELGLVAPVSARSLLLLLPVMLYLILFFGLAIALGLPPAGTMLIILVNACLVGISEELACRGVLFQGLRARFGIWPSIWLASGVFGVMHVLNGFVTGNFGIAVVQALAAFCTGMLFMAIRVRTGSLYPCIAAHTLWNLGALLAVVAAVQQSGGQQPSPELGLIAALPVLGVLPNLLYGLYLLRHVSRHEPEAQAVNVTRDAA